VLAGLLASPGAAAGTQSRCRPAGAIVIAASPQARVYRLGGVVYGCDIRTGRRTGLGSGSLRPGSARVERVALAGIIVAYALTRSGVDTGSASVSVRRLSDGRELSSEPAITGLIPVEAYQSVDSLVVKRDASVAWIATVNSIIGRGSGTEVHSLARGRLALLDSGSAIVPTSLRLHDSKLTWRHGASTRSATLS